MIKSLQGKIVITFTSIILIGLILMVTIINRSTRDGYQHFARDNDLFLCSTLDEPLTEFYSLKRSWDGVEQFLNIPMRRGEPRMQGMNRASVMGSSILLTDNQGVVVSSSQNRDGYNHEKIDKKILKSGYPIKFNNQIVGYLFTGSMLRQGLNPGEERFLNNITRIIVVVTIFIMLLSVAVGYYLAGRLTKPITALSLAAKKIEAGDYNTRVVPKGDDEVAYLGRSFNSMALSIEENIMWRKQIVSDTAHELRTPVSLIQGNLEMILEGIYRPDKERIEGIYNETVQLSGLISDLQQLSSAESGSLVIKKSPLSLNNLIRESFDIFRSQGIKAGVEFQENIPKKLPIVLGDSSKLKQVFTNIISNALRHTPKDGIISISSKITDNVVSLTLEDSGCGIPKEDIDRIFERFYRVDSSRNRELGGRGLGLAISREIIKLHNGNIFAESVLGYGTKIIISLPIHMI